MRLIGHLADETSANTFSDYLFVQGITSEVEAGKEGYAIWIHSEDQWVKAGAMLAAFAGNPTDPAYQREAGRAKGLKAEALAQEERVASRVQGRAEVFKATNSYGVGALTVALIGVSLVIQLMREACASNCVSVSVTDDIYQGATGAYRARTASGVELEINTMNSGVTNTDYSIGDTLHAHLPSELIVVLGSGSRLQDVAALEGVV